MISSLRSVIGDAYRAYATTPRNRWVLEWAGQVVICTGSIYWTAEVTEAMNRPNGMDEYLLTNNKQIDQIVELVRGKLEPGARITLGALTVIDVHGK